jgi:hypothetical protein
MVGGWVTSSAFHGTSSTSISIMRRDVVVVGAILRSTLLGVLAGC